MTKLTPVQLDLWIRDLTYEQFLEQYDIDEMLAFDAQPDRSLLLHALCNFVARDRALISHRLLDDGADVHKKFSGCNAIWLALTRRSRFVLDDDLPLLRRLLGLGVDPDGSNRSTRFELERTYRPVDELQPVSDLLWPGEPLWLGPRGSVWEGDVTPSDWMAARATPRLWREIWARRSGSEDLAQIVLKGAGNEDPEARHLIVTAALATALDAGGAPTAEDFGTAACALARVHDKDLDRDPDLFRRLFDAGLDPNVTQKGYGTALEQLAKGHRFRDDQLTGCYDAFFDRDDLNLHVKRRGRLGTPLEEIEALVRWRPGLVERAQAYAKTHPAPKRRR